MAVTLSPALQAKLAAIKKAQQLQKAQAKPETLETQTKPSAQTQPPVVETESANENESANVSVTSTTSTTAVPSPSGSNLAAPVLVAPADTPEYEPFKMKLATLQQQLEEQVPGFANTLRDLHREMSQDPNVVTILSPQEISIIVAGLARHMDTTVVVAKKATSKKSQPIIVSEL